MSVSTTVAKAMIAVGFAFAFTQGAQAFDGGDAAKGEGIFKKCMSCHMVGDGAQNKVGPVLNAVFGRQLGTFEGYKYGKDIVALGETGVTWTEDEMFEYLADPKKYLRAKLDNKKAKSKMSFKLKKEEERNDIIAYLLTLSPDYTAGGGEGEEESSTTTN